MTQSCGIDHSGEGSSVGRASAFQADCRGFKPRLSLHGPVAQGTEHQPSKLLVTGSNPVGVTAYLIAFMVSFRAEREPDNAVSLFGCGVTIHNGFLYGRENEQVGQMKLHVAKFWAQKHNDRRWTDCGYHYSLTPWSYDTNLHELHEGWMIEPFPSFDVGEQEIGNYQIEQSNVSQENNTIIKSGRDLILRLEQRYFQSHYP